jgi:Flp pilus assembly pilin Flp
MILRKVKTFFIEEEAATAVEYAILLTLIVLAIARSALLLGDNARDSLDATASAIGN